MRLSVGSKISYPLQGPCLIGPVVTKIIGGAPAEFHQFTPLGEGGAEFFVPSGQSPAAGVRRLLEKSEIPKVLKRLSRRPRPSGNGSARAADHLKLCASGSALDLAEVIASLTELGGMNRIHGERGLLEKVRRLLAREIAEVMDESESAAEARIDAALAARGKAPRARRKGRGGA